MKHSFAITALPATLLGLLTFFLISCQAPQSELDNWVDKVHDHLNQSPGGQLIAEALVAHGGLKNWLENEVLEFRWIYHMNDRGPDAVVNTKQSVDTSSLKAVHTVPNSDVRFGWDGSDAWISPADAEFPGPPPRFWSLTPYYFVGIPFVFADLNANFELLTDSFEFEGTDYDQVKVTYNAEAGDAPDDYYKVLVHPATKQVAGVRYIVTSPLVAPNGPGPEKLLTLESLTEIGGIPIPTKHRSFKMYGDSLGEHIRDAETQEIRWLKRTVVDFVVPENSKKL